MATHETDVLDPMYNFDTHFPERFHMQGDLQISSTSHSSSGSDRFRKKKSGRSQRSGARYKTQPVTFTEILEVDEEPATSGPGVKDKGRPERSASQDNMLGQLQAFSKSMDGLIPKTAMIPNHVMKGLSRSGSFTRSGSRKYQRHPECIPERVEAEQAPKSPLPQQQQQQRQLCDKAAANIGQAPPAQLPSTVRDLGQTSTSDPSTAASSTSDPSPPTPPATLSLPGVGDAPSSSTGAASPVSPLPSPNMAPRRQKISAKAKKRQKAQEESSEGS